MKLNSVFITLFLLISAFASAQIVSNFNTDDEGWKCFNANNSTITAVTYNAAGGNPGGNISFSSTFAQPVFYFDAPAKYLINLSSSYGLDLKFDLMQSMAGTDVTQADIVINSVSFGSIVYVLPTRPATGSWTSYTVPLIETDNRWHVSSIAGAAPTKDQMKQILAQPSSIRIRLKYYSGNTFAVTGFMDNVSIGQPAIVVSPTISSFTPESGLPGTSVTINGSNFNTTASQNVVYFGGVQATVTSSNASQLVVTSPPGARLNQLSVTNLATGRSAESQRKFLPQFNNNEDNGGQIIPASMAPRKTIPLTNVAGNFARVVNVGDIDGDSWNDIVITENQAKLVSVFRNLGTTDPLSAASFASKVTFPIINPGKGYSVLADFDGDGKLDYVTSNSDGFVARIAIYRNTSTPGNINFAAAEYQQSSSYADGPIHAADIDGDGRPELLGTFDNSSGGASAYFFIFQNLSKPGDIEFAALQDFDFGVFQPGNRIITGDLNNDGKPEIGVVSGFSSGFHIFENTSTPGTISLLSPFAISTGALIGASFTDMDADGKLDLVFSNNGTTKLNILKNQYNSGALSATSFAAVVSYPSTVNGSPQGGVTVSDINSDGKPDVVMAGGADISILENIAAAGTINATSLRAGVPFTGTGNNTYNSTPAVVDLNGDNKPDIIVGETNAPVPMSLVLYENKNFPAPEISALLPSSGQTNETVAITGNHLKTGIVTPDGTAGMAETRSPASIISQTIANISVPYGAISAPLDFSEHNLYSNRLNFSVTFGTSRVIDNTSFADRIVFNIGGNIRDALSVADWNQDGHVDVAVIENYSNLKIFKNVHGGGDISSSSLTDLPVISGAGYNLTTFDIDGDSKLDLNIGSQILHNSSSFSNITFDPNIFTTTTAFNNATSADFNRDGKIDIVTVDGGINVNILENWSNDASTFAYNGYLSTFKPAITGLTRPTNSGDVVAADFDGDKYDDIITANPFSNNISIFRNLGTGGRIEVASFATAQNIATHNTPNGITASDFDGDGKIDMAVVFNNNSVLTTSVFLNTSSPGTISFAAPVDLACLSNGLLIRSQDLDGDGKAELIMLHAPNPGPGSFSVFQNKSTSGTLSFGPAINTNFGTYNPRYLNIADINSDSKPDLLFVGTPTATGSNALIVYQNNIKGIVFNIDQQPVDADICEGTDAAFTTAASGTTNIKYQWQISNKVGTLQFNNLVNADGISGVSTATLRIRTSEFPDADLYFYRCVISGDFIFDNYTNNVSVTYKTGCGSAPVIGDVNGQVIVGGSTTIPLGQYITDPDNDINLSSLTITRQPTSGAAATINGEYDLIVDYTGLTFTGTDTLEIEVCDLSGLCVTHEVYIVVGITDGDLIVYNGISPDGNNKNEKWVIQNIETNASTRQNHVAIFNRWGDTVYETDNYDNSLHVFIGKSKGGSELPSGTYFYRITFTGGRKSLSGYLSLKR